VPIQITRALFLAGPEELHRKGGFSHLSRSADEHHLVRQIVPNMRINISFSLRIGHRFLRLYPILLASKVGFYRFYSHRSGLPCETCASWMRTPAGRPW